MGTRDTGKTCLLEGWMIRQHINPMLGSVASQGQQIRHYFVLFANGKLKQYTSKVAYMSGSAYPELIAELRKAKFMKIYMHHELPHNGIEINFGFESIWLCPESLSSFEAWYERIIVFTEERITAYVILDLQRTRKRLLQT